MIKDLFPGALCAAVVCAAPTISAEEGGFARIFDGRSLAGWEEMPAANQKAWSVVDGVIVGEGDKGRGYLVYQDRDLADFELKFSYRFPGMKGNSGVNVRAATDETGKRLFKSYHADLGHVGIGPRVLGAWDFHTPGRTEHACVRGTRLVIDAHDRPTVTKLDGAVSAEEIHKGGWNDVHLVVIGNTFRMAINGKPSSEFTEHLPIEKRLTTGMLQLQLHDPGMVVMFRDIRLKVLGRARNPGKNERKVAEPAFLE